MISNATFTTSDFEPTDFVPDITTGLTTGHLRMIKHFEGGISGRSITQFTSAFDQQTGVGTYVAMESFEGTVDGRHGTFNLVHAASTSGTDRANEYGLIVPSSGTGELSGIRGSVTMQVDPDGIHRMVFDYEV
ncbi:DUF3224 domain-containing protein [Nakamurella lactea]|uniref:DUF3224 domain-containing protein n=1 Tax=Nakamurella lactea TaxID=459515 RepID=UPI00041D08D9|nr:DUF3224 domain-containing protein [Nakamurella lactea]